MANTGFKGIDVRQTGGKLLLRQYLQDVNGDRVISGTTSVYLVEYQDDGSLKTYDFNDNTFKAGAVTTEAVSATYRKTNNNTTDTGLWTYLLGTVSGFTPGAVYSYRFVNSNAVPQDVWRDFQWGSAEGDLATTANGAGVAALQSDVTQWKTATAPANTGDAFARLGAPAGASTAADIAAIKTDSGNLITRLTTARAGYLDNLNGMVAQSGDAFARLGAPAGASHAADVAAVKTDTGNLITRLTAARAGYLDNLNGMVAQTGDAFARLGAPAGANVSADIAAVKVDTGNVSSRLTSTRAGYLDNLSGGAVATATNLALVTAKLPSVGFLTGTSSSSGFLNMATATGNFPGSVASVAGAVGSVTAGVNLASTGLDAVSKAPPPSGGSASWTYRDYQMWLVRRWSAKTVYDTNLNTLTMYEDDLTNVISQQSLAIVNGVQTQGPIG